jgi:O-antigen/teichoic acid export membrane protein
MMILLLPLTLFGQTTSQAYYAEIAKISRKNPRKIYSLTKSVTKRLFAFSVIPFLGLLIFGPWLFVFVFGEIWREAGVFASILAINLLTMFIANPITSALNVLGKQLYYLQINLIRLIMVCVVFYIVYLLGMSSYFALFLYSISISFHRIFVYYRILQMIKSCENY